MEKAVRREPTDPEGRHALEPAQDAAMPVRRMLFRRNVALAFFIAALLGIFVLAFAINMTRF
jgi:hypothetical protein